MKYIILVISLLVFNVSRATVQEVNLVQSQDELNLSLQEGHDPDIQDAVDSLSRIIEFSPKAQQARLEACLDDSAELLGTGYTAWVNCHSKCDNNLKNQYCARNNAEVCKDRCDCYFDFSGCEGK